MYGLSIYDTIARRHRFVLLPSAELVNQFAYCCSHLSSADLESHMIRNLFCVFVIPSLNKRPADELTNLRVSLFSLPTELPACDNSPVLTHRLDNEKFHLLPRDIGVPDRKPTVRCVFHGYWCKSATTYKYNFLWRFYCICYFLNCL